MPKVRELDKDFNKANLYGYIERIFVIIFQTLFKGDIDLFRQYIEKVNNNINTLNLNYILKELRSNGKLNINHPKRKWFKALNISRYSSITISNLIYQKPNKFSNYKGNNSIKEIKTVIPLVHKNIFVIYESVISKLKPWVKVNDYLWQEFVNELHKQ